MQSESETADQSKVIPRKIDTNLELRGATRAHGIATVLVARKAHQDLRAKNPDATEEEVSIPSTIDVIPSFL